MKIPLTQVDAFTSSVFGGNPAAVVPLGEWLPSDVMQKIAMENQLSETAFFVPEGSGFRLRWFTPNKEVNLCGHATLATAHVIFSQGASRADAIEFETRSGTLTVKRWGTGYEMDFPADKPGPCSISKEKIEESIGSKTKEVLAGREDIVAIVESAKDVARLTPDFRLIAELAVRGILVSARGDQSDFVSRCFFPRFGIDEDPVTGSAHTTLAPYWGEALGRRELRAKQISARGGELECLLAEDRVCLRGQAVTYLRGEIEI